MRGSGAGTDGIGVAPEMEAAGEDVKATDDKTPTQRGLNWLQKKKRQLFGRLSGNSSK